MTLIPWMPFKDVSQWRDEMERFWQHAMAGSPLAPGYGPRLEVFQTDSEVVARAEVPGLGSKEDLEISATRDTLTISGETKRNEDVKQVSYHRSERYYGTFSRTINLPAQVNWEEARASYKNGILEVRLPKVEQPKQHKVVPVEMQ